MLPGKKPLSTDRKKYWHAGDTPANTPRKCRCLQSEDLPLSSGKHGYFRKESSLRESPFVKPDFTTEVVRALNGKIPERSISKDNPSPQWIKSQDASNSTETENYQSSLRTYIENNYNPELNVHNLSASASEMDYELDSSFNDRLSTMATCPSDRSNYDSLSDFEISFSDEESSKAIKSLDMDNLEIPNPLYLGSDDYKLHRNTTSRSFDNLQKTSCNHRDFEVTL